MSKSVKNNNNLTEQNTVEAVNGSNMIEILRKIIFIALMVVVFYPPYFKGLFFESEVLPSEILVFLISIVFWVYKYLNKDRKFLKTPLEYAAFGFVAVYLVSILVSVSIRSALVEWLKYCMFFSVFYILSDIIKTQKEKMTVLWVVIASAVGVSLLGIDGMAGSVFSNIVNLFVPKNKPLLYSLFVNGRIFSVVQYPGALSAYLTAALFISVIPGVTNSKLWIKALSGALSSIIMFALIFTFSRGAFVLIPVALILFLVILPKGSKIRCIFYILSAALPTALVGLNIIRSYLAELPGHTPAIWLHVAVAAALSAGCVILTQYFIEILEKVNWKVYAATVLVIIIGTVITASVVLNSATALDLSGMDNSPVRRDIALKPDGDYKLVLNIEASVPDKDVNLYTVKVFNKTEKNILFDSKSQIAELTGKSTNGTEKKEIEFKVPKDSKLVELEFLNSCKGAKVKFDNSRIVLADSSKEVMKVTLKYKYLTNEIAERFKNLLSSKSAVERIVFYKDGIKTVGDHPILGAGGGAWQLVYFKHQSYNYYTTQTHNYFLQLAVESGAVGLIIMLGLIISIVMILVRHIKDKNIEYQSGILKSSVITAVVFMLMHSAIDFDFSLSAIFLLFWELLAVLNVRNESPESVQTEISSDAEYKRLNIKPLIAGIVAVVILVFPITLTAAGALSDASSKALDEGKADKALENKKVSTQLDPFNPQFRYDYADILLKNGNYKEAVKNVEEAERWGKNDIEIVARVSNFYTSVISIDKANIEKSIKAADEAVKIGPFVAGAWSQKVNSLYQTVLYYLGNRDSQKGLAYVDKTLNVLEEVKQINKGNMNPIILNPEAYEKIERMEYLKGLKEQMPISKLMFYNIPKLDVNMDNIPDQWSTGAGDNVKISSSGDIMTVENKNSSKPEFIKSRDIFVRPNKTYRIELEMDSDVNSIPYSITNTDLTDGKLKKINNNNVFYGEIVTPKESEITAIALNIGVVGKYEIKSIRIVEE